MSVHEAALGLAFLLQRLRDDTTVMSLSPGGVQVGSARVGTLFPVTLVSFQSGIDVLTLNARRLMVDALYQVKAVGSDSASDAVVALASAIDDALGGDQGLRHISVTGGHILGCNRQSSLLYHTSEAGMKYMHLGGIHRIRNQQAS